jgi:hypothetical protein
MPKGTTVERALGNLYMVMNRAVTHQSPKIQDAQTQEEQLALAITYCFDIQRKLEYACHALEAFAEHGDPELAHQLGAAQAHCSPDDARGVRRDLRKTRIQGQGTRGPRDAARSGSGGA